MDKAQHDKALEDVRAARDAKWIELQQKGWSNVRIARYYGVSESSVRRRTK